MCGLAGEVRWDGGASRDRVSRMVEGIQHRGPDDRGLWNSGGGHCVLGHARLSILDLSPLGHQPMVDPQTGNALVFNGEIYNFQALRRECETLGDSFLSNSDTEVLLALYRRHGVDCLRRLRGMFAFAIWDQGLQRLFLARDRVGKKPLHYALGPSGLTFCSEIHPLSGHPEVPRDMDPDALELYLQLQAVPAPWSIYRAIRKLPPAHFALFDREGLRLERYWDVEYRDKLRISEAEAMEGLEEKLKEAVRLRMIADVPLGALLSGGVDSSLVVALMAGLAGEPVRTFSIGFREQAFDELPFAQQAADRCATIHHPEIVEGDVATMLPLIARHYGEPFADSSAVPSFLVCRTARRHVTVALNGDGGDELLGGYPRYRVPAWSVASGRLLARLLGPRRIVDLVPLWSAASTLPTRILRRAFHDVVSPEIGGLLMFMGYWNDGQRAGLLAGRGNGGLLPSWRLKWMQGAFNAADNPIDRMLWLDNHTYLPDDLLVKMDIASMHCGLETRSPLLDHEVIEYCARLPVSFKVQRKVGKHLLKKLAERYYPKAFVHRPKMGFGIPVAQWLRGPLKAHAEALLFNRDLMEPLDSGVIKASWARLLGATGRADSEAEAGRVWALMMYGQWRALESGSR